MNNCPSIERYIILFLPWILALLFMDNYVLSYLVAWLGSFFILYITLTGKIKSLPDDRSIAEQLMRPIFLVQLIFAGYMCCTSIFYFFDVLGYVDFNIVSDLYLVDQEKLKLTAQCQRYYCLAHASFVSGLLVSMRHSVPIYTYDRSRLSKLIFTIALITISLSYLFTFFDGLSQFSHQLNTLSFIAGTLALAFAISERRMWSICLGLIIYGFNFYQALISGFKEPIILSVLILGVFLYPNYKKTIVLTFVPLLLLLFILLPTYNRIFRQHAWSSDNISADQAGALALEATFDQEDTNDNWFFFTYRLSEINMFTKYVQSTPDYIDYYGFDLVQQSLMSVIPRVFWPSKPITEQLVMERVYKAGVVNRESRVSAKPAFIVDAYLSGGILGIFICLFIYGTICQRIANKAEELFGGYILGVALVFTGLFQVFWRGQSFEFLFNTVCWSYVTMHLVFYALRAAKVLKSN